MVNHIMKTDLISKSTTCVEMIIFTIHFLSGATFGIGKSGKNCAIKFIAKRFARNEQIEKK